MKSTFGLFFAIFFCIHASAQIEGVSWLLGLSKNHIMNYVEEEIIEIVEDRGEVVLGTLLDRGYDLAIAFTYDSSANCTVYCDAVTVKISQDSRDALVGRLNEHYIQRDEYWWSDCNGLYNWRIKNPDGEYFLLDATSNFQ